MGGVGEGGKSVKMTWDWDGQPLLAYRPNEVRAFSAYFFSLANDG